MQTLSVPSPRVAVRASWDTHQRLSYNPNAPRKPPKNPNTTSKPKTLPSVTLSVATTRSEPSVLDLPKRPSSVEEIVERDECYMGYERWLPSPPKVQKPRSAFNAASLAYIGDCIYEDALLQKLLSEKYLSEEERKKFPRTFNIRPIPVIGNTNHLILFQGVSKDRNRSNIESLVGYLYLKNVKRLEEIMLKLGFTTDSSMQLILEEAK
ncbi:hypothetical protein F2P56_027959, partial [Juglans regia]